MKDGFKLSESQLDAFYSIAISGSFSKATKVLHLSQPALSRRVQALEDQLELTLFDRTPQGIILTEAGRSMLQYVKNKKALEEQVLLDLQTGEAKSEFSGLIRIASHSSVIEPIVVPLLAAFLVKNPNVQIELSVIDNAHLDEYLNYSKTDVIISNREGDRKDVNQHKLGEEEFVCIESDSVSTRSNVYLDTNPQDRTTELFFNLQSHKPKKIIRSFMQDENGILSGVRYGIGRAIKPKHTLKNVNDIKIVRNLVSLKRPLYMRFSKKIYYTKLETKVHEIILKDFAKFLKV